MKPSLNNSAATLTGAKQTMLSWARMIESYEEIPQSYKVSCKALLENRQPFPHVVLVPKIGGARHSSTEKLLCEVDNVFHVWERIGSQVISSAYPLDTICVLEMGNVLLYSWFKLNGLTNDGVASSCIIVFNTATVRHLEPFMNKMRPLPTDVNEVNWQAELAKFDHLASHSFKFMNYARESLIHGEEVISTIWQPSIRQPAFTLRGWPFYRTRDVAHLVFLTDKEIVLIREDEQATETKGSRYGGIWQYIPLRHIASVSLSEPIEGLTTLSLTLAFDGQQVNKVFEVSNTQELAHLLGELNQRIG